MTMKTNGYATELMKRQDLSVVAKVGRKRLAIMKGLKDGGIQTQKSTILIFARCALGGAYTAKEQAQIQV